MYYSLSKSSEGKRVLSEKCRGVTPAVNVFQKDFFFSGGTIFS